MCKIDKSYICWSLWFLLLYSSGICDNPCGIVDIGECKGKASCGDGIGCDSEDTLEDDISCLGGG